METNNTAQGTYSINSPDFIKILKNREALLYLLKSADNDSENIAIRKSLNDLLNQFQKLNPDGKQDISSESFDLNNLTYIERKLFGENHQNAIKDQIPQTSTNCVKHAFENLPLDFKWINNSVNSYSGTDGKTFTKIQISDLTDPLINEVIVNKALKAFETPDQPGREANNQPKRFSQYVDHFVITNLPGQKNGDSFYALQTEHINMLSIGNFLKNLSDPIKGIELEYTNPVVKKVLAQLDEFVGDLMEVGGKIGFVHNDIHMGNVVLDTNAYMGTGRQLVYKLIDYGRSSINNYNYNDIIDNPNNSKLFENYCMNADFIKEQVLFNDDASWKRFQVPAFGKNYMCDSASICLAICLHIGGFPWPKWMKIEYNNNDYIITIYPDQYKNYIEYSQDNNLEYIPYENIYKALLWMSVCIKNYLTIYNLPNITLSLLRQSLLLGNFVFNAVEFKKISDAVNNFFLLEPNKKLLEGGGKSIKKKLNRKKRMSGGTPENPQQPVTTSQMPTTTRPKYFDDCMVSTNTLLKPMLVNVLNAIHYKNISSLNFIETSIVNELEPDLLVTNVNKCSVGATSCAAQMRAATEAQPYGALQDEIPVTGGGARPLQTQKTYKIITDKVTARRYIRKSNKQWFLDENRGKYKYTDETKKFIKMK